MDSDWPGESPVPKSGTISMFNPFLDVCLVKGETSCKVLSPLACTLLLSPCVSLMILDLRGLDVRVLRELFLVSSSTTCILFCVLLLSFKFLRDLLVSESLRSSDGLSLTQTDSAAEEFLSLFSLVPFLSKVLVRRDDSDSVS